MICLAIQNLQAETLVLFYTETWFCLQSSQKIILPRNKCGNCRSNITYLVLGMMKNNQWISYGMAQLNEQLIELFQFANCHLIGYIHIQ